MKSLVIRQTYRRLHDKMRAVVDEDVVNIEGVQVSYYLYRSREPLQVLTFASLQDAFDTLKRADFMPWGPRYQTVLDRADLGKPTYAELVAQLKLCQRRLNRASDRSEAGRIADKALKDLLKRVRMHP